MPPSKTILSFMLLATMLASSAAPLHAQDAQPKREAIEVDTGDLDKRESVSFLLNGVREGDRLEIRASGQSGNLDPQLVLMKADEPLEGKLARTLEALMVEVETGADPHAAFAVIAKQQGWSFDDDSGPGYSSRIYWQAPEDGDYRIFLTGGLDVLALSEVGRRVSMGRYKLVVGLNAPLGANPVERGARFLEREQAARPISIQRIEGSVSAERPLIEYRLKDLLWGESLRVHVNAVEEGRNAPRIRLLDFGGKELASANVKGNHPAGEYTYAFDSRSINHSIIVESTEAEPQPFVLLVGRGTRQRLDEATEEQGQSLVDVPISVRVGLALEQIVNVDQKSENFGAVANIILSWEDDRLAFGADSCDCDRQVFDLPGFEKFVAARNAKWPQFIFRNQQGNRWAQERVVEVRTTGAVHYFERFTTTFQAPEFDFRDFPLDDQEFFIHVRALRPQEEFEFVPDTARSSLGTKLGEEEWMMRDFAVAPEPEGRYSGIAFGFIAQRHMVYYLLRVLIPVGLIVMVGWLSFLIQDYAKRIDISAGNMLAFIAFNFTISSDLPRLGYVTFIDMLMLVTFVVCAVLVGVNVYCRRQELEGKKDHIARVDRWLVVIYPICFLLPPAIVYFMAL